MQQKQSLSVVVPIFNEEGNIPMLFEQIKNAVAPLGREWEAVFVDDASTDGSLDAIRALAEQHPELRYFSFQKNQGQSAAFCAGFAQVKHPIIVTMDADLQNDPADVPALLDAYDQGYDMVVGWRAKRKDTWIKRISSKIGNKVRRWITKDTVKDTGCSLKVMNTEMVSRLPKFKNMHRYLPPLMLAQGARITEVKVNHRERHAGVSKYGTWDRLKAGIYDLIGVRWLLNRTVTYEIGERND